MPRKEQPRTPAKLYVEKANGDLAPFDEEKIRHSLQRVHADESTIQSILQSVRNEVHPGIRTKDLYRIVFSELRKRNRPVAGQYHLKAAIMELGPTGFPFEKFVAALFDRQGYKTQTDQIIEGECVKHEVDVIATKGEELMMMECKFHHLPGMVADVKAALYVHSRFEDIGRAVDGLKEGKKFRGWLVTNTRLTADAEQYGTCVGLGLISWNFPNGASLRERINQTGLFPITCMTSLKQKEKQRLLEEMIVLVPDLVAQREALRKIGIERTRIEKIMAEAISIANMH